MPFPAPVPIGCRKYVALDTGLLIGIYFLQIILGQSHANGLEFGLPYAAVRETVKMFLGAYRPLALTRRTLPAQAECPYGQQV